jgi:hypothetical protein
MRLVMPMPMWPAHTVFTIGLVVLIAKKATHER